MALTNLERFLAAVPRLDETLDDLAADARTTEILLQVFSTSQHYGEVLIRDPELLDWLQAGAERRDRAVLVEGLWNTMAALPTEDEQKLALRRFRQRESLRIGYNDIVRGFPLEVITQDLSHLADACVEAAVRLARAHAEARYRRPDHAAGLTARFVVLGLGKLGGEELNYSSDIDLIFLYDDEGQTTGPKVVSNAELFARMGSEIVRLLAEHTALGIAYRVDMRLRPDGEQGAAGPVARLDAGLLRDPRPDLGTPGADQVPPDRRRPGTRPDLPRGDHPVRLSPLPRRRGDRRDQGDQAADRAAHRLGRDGRGRGQDRPRRHPRRRVRRPVPPAPPRRRVPRGAHGNTLHAIAQLERVGCLTAEERYIMDDTYRFLRRVEHRLQIVFDRQTHEMPRDMESVAHPGPADGLRARERSGNRGPARRTGSSSDYRGKTELNRRILNHLLHDAFRGDDGAAVDPIVDLVLDPDPAPELISEVLGPYPFRDRATAYQNLLALAREDFPFLSQARCRHFLAAIAPRLLQAVGRTPDPDMTLTNLEKVSASLGRQGDPLGAVQLQPAEPAAVRRACATSQFLSEILINNPGMIDDLMDSLVVDRPSPGSAIKEELAELCEGAEDLVSDHLELPEQGMGPDRYPRHPRPGAGPRRDPRAGGRRRGDPDRRWRTTSGTGVRRDTGRPRRRPAGASRPLGDPRAGKVRRPRAELPQRPGPGLPPRGRRDDRGRADVDPERPVRDRGRPAGAQGAGERLDRPARSTRSTPGSGLTAPPARWS